MSSWSENLINSGDFGGDKKSFPWLGLRYKVNINELGANPRSWISRLAAKRCDVSFDPDGSLRLNCGGPCIVWLFLRKVQPCWRWDALANQMIVNFVAADKKTVLPWRWEEVKPVTEVNSIVTGWEGISHVRGSTYSFTMVLDEASLPEVVPPNLSILGRQGSYNVSSSFSSDEDSSGVERQRSFGGVDAVGFITDLASKYDESIQMESKTTHDVCESIDRLWFDELVLQSIGELLGKLIEIAREVEKGSFHEDQVSVQATNAIHNVKALAVESLEVRAAARGSVSIDGGLIGLRQSLATQLVEVEEEIMPLVSKFTKPSVEAARDVRKRAKKMLNSVLEDFEATGTLKEAKSEMFMQLEDNLGELQLSKQGLAVTLLQAARANPENMSLQKGCVEISASIDGNDVWANGANHSIP